MRLKPSSYLILGMLSQGRQTGYEIKRAVDRSTRFFWAASLAQVYPELAALEEDGYVVSADEPRGARPRKTYQLTDTGQAAFEAWLTSPRTPQYEFRDEGLLRLFFADSVPLADGVEVVRRLRIDAEEVERAFREEVLPLAQADERRFHGLAARQGAAYFAWRAAWFREIEAELEDEL